MFQHAAWLCEADAMPKSRSSSVLSGWWLVSLRPVAGHQSLRRAAAAFGARVVAVSTLRWQPLPASAALAAALTAPQVIFTSPAAVRFALQHGPLPMVSGQRGFAVGRTTANALRRAGMAEPRWPDTAQRAEGLLALPELQAVQGQPVGLITAPGGRDLLATGLAARGARVIRAEVYRRQPVTPSPARLRALFAPHPARALLVTSGEALAGLWDTLSPGQRQQACQWPVVASSARLAGLLRSDGFTTVIESGRPDPRSLLEALAAHVGSASLPVR